MKETILLQRHDNGSWAVTLDPPSGPTDKYTLQPEGDLWRLYALREVRDRHNRLLVRPGQQGGLVQDGMSLSQAGECWVSENAQILGSGRAIGNAYISGYAIVKDHAQVSGNTQIGHRAVISGHAMVRDTACVWDYGIVANSTISAEAQVRDHGRVEGGWHMSGCAAVSDYASFGGNQHSVRVETGNFRGNMKITSCRGFLVINTCWGPLTVAPEEGRSGWHASVGCQDVFTLEDLRELTDEAGSGYEKALLPHWEAMITEAAKRWNNPDFDEDEDDDDED